MSLVELVKNQDEYMPYVSMVQEAMSELRMGVLSAGDREFHRHLLGEYASGWKDGVTVYWRPTDNDGPQGFLIAGDPMHLEHQHESQWGRCGYMWGYFVRKRHRGQGAVTAMWQEAQKALAALGFTHCRGYVSVGNKTSYDVAVRNGAVPTAVELVYDLRSTS